MWNCHPLFTIDSSVVVLKPPVSGTSGEASLPPPQSWYRHRQPKICCVFGVDILGVGSWYFGKLLFWELTFWDLIFWEVDTLGSWYFGSWHSESWHSESWRTPQVFVLPSESEVSLLDRTHAKAEMLWSYVEQWHQWKRSTDAINVLTLVLTVHLWIFLEVKIFFAFAVYFTLVGCTLE